MTETRIITKIRKLLALATSSNVNEAATAAAHAQRLIAKHRINQAVLLANPEEVGLNEDPLDEGARVAQWKLELAMVVAEANGCRIVILKDGRRSTIKLVGGGEDIDITRELYAWLVTEVQRLTRGSGLRGRDSLDTFRLGAIATIEQRLAEANEAARKIGLKDAKKEGSETTALVRIGFQSLVRRGEEAERLVDELCEGREEESIGEHGQFDVDAFVTGAAMANTVDLSGHQTKLESR